MAKTTNREKKNLPMLMKMFETQENKGATSKHPEHTDIKIFGHIPEVFVA